MPSIFSATYLSREPVEHAMRAFGKRFSKEQSVLDIGCGKKPYAHFFSCRYIGIDPLDIAKPDIVAPAWSIPVPDQSFDGIILNQSLEHIEKTTETISEIKRILKPGGLCIVTVPHTMKNHAMPIPIEKSSYKERVNPKEVPYWHEDYYRFTKFGLITLFKDFQIKSIQETSGYFGTLFQLVNYFFSSLGSIRWIFTPIFFINNILGLACDRFFLELSVQCGSIGFRLHHTLYNTLPLNYILILTLPNKI